MHIAFVSALATGSGSTFLSTSTSLRGISGSCPRRETRTRLAPPQRIYGVQSNLKSNPDDVNISPPPPPTPKASGKDSPKRQLRRRVQAVKKEGMTNFGATIDNMTMKRMGRGTIFYGEKTEALEPVAPSEDDEFEELKPNAVLVTGATGQTGQWITLGLLTQDFNVRVMTRKFGKAEKLFGPSGSNVDVFEANLSNYSQVKEAVDGSKIIVCCAAGSILSSLSESLNVVDTKGMENLVKAAKECGSVEKILYISSNNVKSIKQQRAERVIIDSGLPYIIIRINSLSDAEGGLFNITLAPVIDNNTTVNRSDKISRVDLAQCVCQALVQNRKLAKMALDDPDAGFEFPDCIISANNTKEPFLPDKRFWLNAFNRISDAFHPEPQDGDPSIDASRDKGASSVISNDTSTPAN